MADQIEIAIAKTRVKEGSGFTATAYFRTRSTAAPDTPATVRYRIDCLTTGRTVLDWTSGTPGESLAIAVTGAHNAMQSQCNRTERKELVVESDAGAADQCRGSVAWTVENLSGVRS